MNIVEKLYKIIKSDNTRNSFDNNQELFQEFFYHNMSIQFYGEKVIEIYKYLLSLNLSEDLETMPYINSNIIEDFNRYIGFLTQSAYLNSQQIDDDYIKKIYDLIKHYYEFKKYESQSELGKIQDENLFTRDYTGAMMIALNSAFFKISNDNIRRMIDSIKNNPYLQKVIEDGKQGKGLLDKDYIFQYVSRFLFNLEFVNEKNIENDFLIQAIRDSKFKDKKTLKSIFENINIFILSSIFNNDLSVLANILEKAFNNQLDAVELFQIVISKLVKENQYREIIEFIMHDERCKIYLDENRRNSLIWSFLSNYPVEITEEEIEFGLKQAKNELFLVNLKKDFKNNNWSEKTKEMVKKATENIPEYEFDYSTAIDILNSIFTSKEQNRPSPALFLECLSEIIRHYLQDENIKIYIVNDQTANGRAYPEAKCIKLSLIPIKKILNTHVHENDSKSIEILDTIFHEARHIEQYKDMEKDDIDSETYKQYKEDVLMRVCTQYYETNYWGISFENDARITGAQMLVALLKSNFPYMNNSIKFYEEEVEKEKTQKEEKKIVFELSQGITIDEALEKLLSINPSIIEKYSVLKREYNEDGSKKISSQEVSK